jgi:hypothetical protein
MTDNSRRTGAAMEAHYRFVVWLVATIEKFPKSHKFTIGDRIEITALDVLEALIEATYTRERIQHPRRANLGIEKLRFLLRLTLHPRKTAILPCNRPSQFLGFELHADGRRRLPDDNVRRFRNRLRGLRDQWRAGTIGLDAVDARVTAWIAHAQHADTWRLRHAIFRGGRFDPAITPEAWTAPCRRVVRGGSWNNNPENLRSANRNRNTTDNRNNNLGFRLGRTLSAGAGVITVAPGAH